METNNPFTIFGPYANNLFPSGDTADNQAQIKTQSKTKSTVKSVKFQGSQSQTQVTASVRQNLLRSTTKTPVAASQSQSLNQPQFTRNPSSKITDWSSFHKKPATSFLLPTQAKLDIRMNQAQERRKTKRTEVVIENRKIDVASLNFQSPAPKTPKKNLTSVNAESNNNIPVVVKESRKEQLLRWKHEKEERNKNGQQKKPPFKAGPAQPPLDPIASKKPRSGMPAPAPARSVGTIPNPEGDKKLATERRVTRAMAKAQVMPFSSTSTNKSNILPIGKKLPNTAASKNSHLIKEKENKLPSISNENPNPINPGVTKKHVEAITNFSNAENAAPTSQMAPTLPIPLVIENALSTNEALTKPKRSKPKGMQFDSIYVEYHDLFVKACSSLMASMTKWSETMAISKDGIPEDICCDIESSLGQAKLLMESKLPQFGELLYFYLSKHQDPQPILGVDLQGWWAVAEISIEKVKQRFEKLVALENNNWIEIIESPQSSGNNVDVSKKEAKSAEGPSNSDPPKIKRNAKANSGFLAFLAEQRRKAMNGDKEKVSSEVDEILMRRKSLSLSDLRIY